MPAVSIIASYPLGHKNRRGICQLNAYIEKIPLKCSQFILNKKQEGMVRLGNRKANK